MSRRSRSPSPSTSKPAAPKTRVKPSLNADAGARSAPGVAGAVVHQRDAELGDSIRIADLAEHEVEVAVVVQVGEVPHVEAPVDVERRQRLGLQPLVVAGRVHREGAVPVVHHQVAVDVGAAAALDPQVHVAVAVDVARRRRLQMEVGGAGGRRDGRIPLVLPFDPASASAVDARNTPSSMAQEQLRRIAVPRAVRVHVCTGDRRSRGRPGRRR